MKQSINTGTFIAIVSVVVVAAAVVSIWIWRAPSVTEVHPVSRAEVNAAMKEAHGGPTPDQIQQIQEWKKTHPGAYTRY